MLLPAELPTALLSPNKCCEIDFFFFVGASERCHPWHGAPGVLVAFVQCSCAIPNVHPINSLCMLADFLSCTRPVHYLKPVACHGVLLGCQTPGRETGVTVTPDKQQIQ